MRIKPFALERYFAEYEFSVRYLLCSSDCDGLPLADLLALADTETRVMWDNLALGYTESAGLPELRQEISRLYKKIEADDVLVVTPQEGIFLVMNALLEPGDEIVCTAPGYQSLYEVATSIGRKVIYWKPLEAGGWHFDPRQLAGSLTPKTKMIVVNFPHNPTGCLPSRQDFDEIIALARKNNLYLFSDEMYRGLEYNPDDRLPAACEVYEKAISLAGMSKAFGLAGLRIGWLATQDAGVLKKIAGFKDYTTICSSAPSEVLALIGLRAREEIVGKNLNLIQANLRLLDAFFKRHGQLFGWQGPAAATVAFPRLLGEQNASSFCKRLVDEAGVLLLPASVYAFGDSHLRFGFGRRNMPEALANFEQWLSGR